MVLPAESSSAALPRLSVFVSSPGDVGPERAMVAKVCETVQAEHTGQLLVQPFFWEREVFHGRSDYQSQIPDVGDFDLVLCLFWSRLGSPLIGPDGAPHPSGTLYELRAAEEAHQRSGRPELLVFVKSVEPVFKASESAEQGEAWRALRGFLDRWSGEETGRGRRAVNEFSDHGVLEAKVLRLLRARARAKLGAEDEAARASWAGSPFRGFERFERRHAPVFLGRTREVERAVLRLEALRSEGCACLLVEGPSGVGKSSFVEAGVSDFLVRPGVVLVRPGVVLVRPGVVPGVTHWRWGRVQPGLGGPTVLYALASALSGPEALPGLVAGSSGEASVPHEAVERLAALIREAPGHLDQLVLSQLAALPVEGPHEARRLLLVVDQLEEAWTAAGASVEDRAALGKALSALARSGRVDVLATVRSDFLGRALDEPELGSLLLERRFALGPPEDEALLDIIRRPARAAGLVYGRDGEGEPLDARLYRDTQALGRALPLLQFTLETLYQRATEEGRTVLEPRDYEALGGIAGAAQSRAEAALSAVSLSAGERNQAFDRLMRRLLVRPRDAEGAGGEAGLGGKPLARRALPLDAALTAADRWVLEALLRAGMLRSEEGRVVLVHERLIASWPRLDAWRGANEAFLESRDRVEQAARAHREHGFAPDGLWDDGLRLGDCQAVLIEDADALEPEARAFAEASVAAALARAERERREASRRLRRVAATAVGLVVVAVLAVGAAVWALRAEQAAVAAREDAEGLIAFMLFDLRDRLAPIGRLELMAGVNQKVEAYYERAGVRRAEEQRRRSVHLDNRGDQALAEGRLGDALVAYREGQAIMERLAGQDPQNAGWQRDLSVSHNNVGNVLVAQGDLGGALVAYREGQAIFERLAGQDPQDAGWQRDLGVSRFQLHAVLREQGQTGAALGVLVLAAGSFAHASALAPGWVEWSQNLELVLGVLRAELSRLPRRKRRAALSWALDEAEAARSVASEAARRSAAIVVELLRDLGDEALAAQLERRARAAFPEEAPPPSTP